jgi:hypothetical protein
MVLAALLLGEACWTALWIARLLPTLAAREWPTLAVLALRSGVGLLQSAAGFGMVQRLAWASRVARLSFLVSAVVLTLELGARVTPTNVFPSHRWPLVAAYWIYAALAVLMSTRRDHGSRAENP